MAKITRKDAAERITALVNGRTQMTEAEFNELKNEIENSTVKDLLKSLGMNIIERRDGTKHGIIGTMHFTYADVEIIEKKIISSVSHYTTNKGKTYDAYNMISKSRAEQMESKGYIYKIVETGELAQEAYDRLIKDFDVVRIYSQTTRVRGFHTFYAMCK